MAGRVPPPHPRRPEHFIRATGAQTSPGSATCHSVSTVCAQRAGKDHLSSPSASADRSVSCARRRGSLGDLTRSPLASTLMAKMSCRLKNTLESKSDPQGRKKFSSLHSESLQSGKGTQLSARKGGQPPPTQSLPPRGAPRLFLATGSSGSCLQCDTLRGHDGGGGGHLGSWRLFMGQKQQDMLAVTATPRLVPPSPQSTPVPHLRDPSVTHQETQGPMAPSWG